jgi:hypothetical protein
MSKSHSTCRYHTLLVDIYTLRVEITFVIVVFTLIRVKSRSCVWKLHSCVSKSQYKCGNHILRVDMWKFTLCVQKSHLFILNSETAWTQTYHFHSFGCPFLRVGSIRILLLCRKYSWTKIINSYRLIGCLIYFTTLAVKFWANCLLFKDCVKTLDSYLFDVNSNFLHTFDKFWS